MNCFRVTSDAGNVVIQGFTLKDGEASPSTTGDSAGYGGGLYAGSQAACLVDCDLVHCAAGLGGAMQAGTAVRCRFKDNYGNSGPGTRASRLINCIVTGTRVSNSSRAIFHSSDLYNCTVIDNAVSAWVFQNSAKAYNSILALHSTAGVTQKEIGDKAGESADCVFGTTAPKGFMQVAGPAVDDYRPLADSDAIAAGKISHLSSLSLPDGIDALKDFSGRKIEADGEGRINAGALQEAVTPAGGALVFKSGFYEVNGRTNALEFYSWVYPDVYPTQYCVRAVLDEGKHLYRMDRFDPGTGGYGKAYPAMVPYRDGTMWMMPPVDPGVCLTNVRVVANTVLYVDPNEGAGSDADGDGSFANPYATLQKAVVSAANKTVVYLKPGEYTNDVQIGASDRGRFRMYQPDNNHYIRIVSTDGAEKTVIRGCPDPDRDDGLGPKAVKGVFLGRNTILQDVTIADCYTQDSTAAGGSAWGAALYMDATDNDNPPQVIDCVITNCHAYRYVSVNYAVLRRCRFIDCSSEDRYCIGTESANCTGFPLFSCYARGMVNNVGGNGAQGIIGETVSGGHVRIYQSTLTGTLGEGRLTGSANISWNSIWYGGLNIYTSSIYTNCFIYNPRGSANGVYGKIDPLFADVSASGALCANSPAIGAGGVPAADNFGADYWKLACGDIDGRPLVFMDGKPTLGAFQHPVGKARVAVSAPNGGGWAFAYGMEYGAMDVEEGDSITVVSAEGSRPCIGVTCNGTEYVFTNGSTSATIPYSVLAGGTNGIAGVYTKDWYVDEKNGSDSNSGFWRTNARKTLADAAELLSSGDTLWVCPGHYTNGAALYASSHTISNRVVVKSGTAVVSTDGPENTFIVGAAATVEPDEYGCGTNAVRCAAVNKNARLSGFTLTGGRANRNGSGEDIYGCAVYGADRDSHVVVDNCIISNNVAANGIVYKCNVFASAFYSNTNTSHGCVRQANAYGCYFDGNTGPCVFCYSRNAWNCTVTRNNLKLDSGGLNTSAHYTLAGGCVRNSFFGSTATEANAVNYDNCVVHSGSTFANELSVTNNVFLVNTSEQEFEDGVPVIGANACVDAGDASLNTNALGNVDLRGFQRVMNGAMDIGCHEADWRGRFSAAMGGGSALGVESADPQVVLTDEGSLTVRDGTLAAEWTNVTGKVRTYGFNVQVTGTGTLTVTLDGEAFATVVSSDGVRRLEFRNDAVSNALAFTYTPGENDEGWAVLGGFSKGGTGLSFSVR